MPRTQGIGRGVRKKMKGRNVPRSARRGAECTASAPRLLGLELAVERLPVHAQDPGGFRAVAAYRLEHALDVASLDLLQRHQVVGAAADEGDAGRGVVP